MPNVVFDEDSAARIANAVRYVEGLQNPEPPRPPSEDDPIEQLGRTVIRGTFSGEWAKNADATVSFTADNGDTGTKTATNYFADVGTSGESSACCIIQAGGEWILIAAECG